jgi:hypothetical protein
VVYSCLRKGQVAGYSEHGNEPSGFLKCGEFLMFVEEDYQVLLMKGLAAMALVSPIHRLSCCLRL